MPAQPSQNSRAVIALGVAATMTVLMLVYVILPGMPIIMMMLRMTSAHERCLWLDVKATKARILFLSPPLLPTLRRMIFLRVRTTNGEQAEELVLKTLS
jgi:hypothetical protein